MFVPIDLLLPILGDLLADGPRRPAPAKPWLGVNAEEVARAAAGRPRRRREARREKAGIKRGDIIVGVGGETTRTLPEFYRKLWALGARRRDRAARRAVAAARRAGSTCRRSTGSITLKLKSTF